MLKCFYFHTDLEDFFGEKSKDASKQDKDASEEHVDISNKDDDEEESLKIPLEKGGNYTH